MRTSRSKNSLMFGSEPIWSYQFRVIVIGDAEVGKSCLVKNFTESRYDPGEATVGVDFASRVIQVNANNCVKLQIWDTAGSERFRAITHSYYRNTCAALLVFDLTCYASFEHVEVWLEEIHEHSNPHDLVILLIGNKADQTARREVSEEEAVGFARLHHLDYMEVSAKTSFNVENAFRRLSVLIFNAVEQGYMGPQAGWDGIRPNFWFNQRDSILLQSNENLAPQPSVGCCLSK